MANQKCSLCGESVQDANHFLSYRPLDPDEYGVIRYMPIQHCVSPNKPA